MSKFPSVFLTDKTDDIRVNTDIRPLKLIYSERDLEIYAMAVYVLRDSTKD